MAETGMDQQRVVDLSKSRVERLHLALADVKIGGMSCNAAAKKWNVTKQTLLSLKKNPGHSFHRPTVTLTDAEEKKIVYWIIQCSLRGSPQARPDVKEGAFRLIKGRKDDNATKPSNKWLNGFMKRHDLSARITQRLTAASACITKSNVIAWFAKIHDVIVSEGLENINASRIYNADESYFLLTPERGQVIVKKGMKNVFETVKDEKTGLTVMLLIRADGEPCKPLIIFPGQRLPAAIRSSVGQNEADMAVTENGWMTAEIFCFFLRSVATQAQVAGADSHESPREKIILYIDNHSSHLKLECFELALELGILMIPLCPNTTFLTQPADVSCFKSLKTLFKSEVSSYKFDNPQKTVSKESFSPIFLKALAKMDPQTVRNGFMRTGLVPWDPEAPDYAKLLAKNKTPPTQDDDSSNDSEVFMDVPVLDISSICDDDLVTEENLESILSGSASAETKKRVLIALARQKLVEMVASRLASANQNNSTLIETPELEPYEQASDDVPTFYSFFGSSATLMASTPVAPTPVAPTPVASTAAQLQESLDNTEPLTSPLLPIPETPKRIGKQNYRKKLPIASTVAVVEQLRGDGNEKAQEVEAKQQRKLLALENRKRKLEIEQKKVGLVERKLNGASSQPVIQSDIQLSDMFQFFLQQQNSQPNTSSRQPLRSLENDQSVPVADDAPPPTKKPRGRPRTQHQTKIINGKKPKCSKATVKSFSSTESSVNLEHPMAPSGGTSTKSQTLQRRPRGRPRIKQQTQSIVETDTFDQSLAEREKLCNSIFPDIDGSSRSSVRDVFLTRNLRGADTQSTQSSLDRKA